MKRGSEPETIEILSEDDVLLAAVKPAGLPTANAPAGRPSLFTWLKERLGQDAFVGIVSRLDAPVSGVVVVAKTPAAAAALAEQFRERAVEKRYLAVVSGRFPAPLGEWVEWHDRIVRGEGRAASRILPATGPGRAPAGSDAGAGQGGGRPAARRERTARDEADAQDARTRARVVRRAGEVSLVELEPLTGRRHQLRAQLAGRGCPIVGDRLYGSRLPFPVPGGIALHATSLSLTHPVTGADTTFAGRAAAAGPPRWRASFPSLFPRGRDS
jgi:23S rRNA pseudouridine1911/1915/1917 synthase